MFDNNFIEKNQLAMLIEVPQALLLQELLRSTNVT